MMEARGGVDLAKEAATFLQRSADVRSQNIKTCKPDTDGVDELAAGFFDRRVDLIANTVVLLTRVLIDYGLDHDPLPDIRSVPRAESVVLQLKNALQVERKRAQRLKAVGGTRSFGGFVADELADGSFAVTGNRRRVPPDSVDEYAVEVQQPVGPAVNLLLNPQGPF